MARKAYEDEVRALAGHAAGLRRAGVAPELIARALVDARNALKLKYRALSSPDLRLDAEQWSISRYGAADGPSIEALRAQGKDWDEIIAAACRPGRGPG